MGWIIRFFCTMSAAATLSSGAAAFAQDTIGQLVDAGGSQLRQREVAALLSDAEYTGVTRLGVPFRIHSKADGSFSGSAGADRKSFAGRWWVEDNGLHCSETIDARSRGETSCATWFRKDSRYFVSDADAARDARLRKREFLKRPVARASSHAGGAARPMRQSAL
jgi:hypothetical protein